MNLPPDDKKDVSSSKQPPARIASKPKTEPNNNNSGPPNVADASSNPIPKPPKSKAETAKKSDQSNSVDATPKLSAKPTVSHSKAGKQSGDRSPNSTLDNSLPNETGIEIIGDAVTSPSHLELQESAPNQTSPRSSPSKSSPVSALIGRLTPKNSPQHSPNSLPLSKSQESVYENASPKSTPSGDKEIATGPSDASNTKPSSSESRPDTALKTTKNEQSQDSGNSPSKVSQGYGTLDTTVLPVAAGSQAMSEKERNSPPSPTQDEKKELIQSDHTLSEDDYDQPKRSDVAGDICKLFGVLFAIGVRAVLFGFGAFTIWLVVYRMQDDMYYLLSISFIFFILETINIVITRAGQERKWFCLCFLCYLIVVIPCIWILEIDRLNSYQSATSNATAVAVDVAGVTTEIKLDPNTLLAVTEQCLIFLLILGRWLLPRGDITRDQLSQLLFVYIGMASDVMELFQLFDESDVREDRTLTMIILAVWSLSLLQFCLVLTMSRNPKKIRTALERDEETARVKRLRLRNTSCCVALTVSELWSLCVSISMQDGPFLAVRLFTIVKYQLINYTIIFFTCKNILVIMLLFYRVMILLLQKLEERNQRDDEQQHEDRPRTKTVSTHLSVSDIDEEASLPKVSSPKAGGYGDKADGIRTRHGNQVAPS